MAAIYAVMSGESLPLDGTLRSHWRHGTTTGYVHLADPHLVETAAKLGRLIAEIIKIPSPDNPWFIPSPDNPWFIPPS